MASMYTPRVASRLYCRADCECTVLSTHVLIMYPLSTYSKYTPESSPTYCTNRLTLVVVVKMESSQLCHEINYCTTRVGDLFCSYSLEESLALHSEHFGLSAYAYTRYINTHLQIFYKHLQINQSDIHTRTYCLPVYTFTKGTIFPMY